MERQDLTPLWKALADPKRRRIVQLLHEKAHTTSEICAHFDVSRFAVMQHLKVLEQAGLIHVRREGRQRWNFLNDALFQEIQQTYLDGESNGAYQLQDVLGFLSREAGVGSDAASATALPPQLKLQQELILPASPGLVYRALTEEIDSWWSQRITANSRIHLEPQVGGRLYEAFRDGGGALYATVAYLEPDQEIRLVGTMGMMDEVVNSLVHIILEPHADESTCLHLAHYFSNQVSTATISAFSRSWEELLTRHLKTFVVQRLQTQPPS